MDELLAFVYDTFKIQVATMTHATLSYKADAHDWADHESDNYCMGSEKPDLWEEENLREKLHS